MEREWKEKEKEKERNAFSNRNYNQNVQNDEDEDEDEFPEECMKCGKKWELEMNPIVTMYFVYFLIAFSFFFLHCFLFSSLFLNRLFALFV